VHGPSDVVKLGILEVAQRNPPTSRHFSRVQVGQGRWASKLNKYC
jgi:hypothetical protein